MPPKLDPNEIKIIYIRVRGGEVPGVDMLRITLRSFARDLLLALLFLLLLLPSLAFAHVFLPAGGSSLAPKIGPLGMSPKKVGDDIQKATKDWKGLSVTCRLTCQNRNATIDVCPGASSLVLRALKEPPRDRKKVKNIKHSGSIPFSEIITIARELRSRSMAKTLAGEFLRIRPEQMLNFDVLPLACPFCFVAAPTWCLLVVLTPFVPQELARRCSVRVSLWDAT
jgi:large subunit ribosomal protein L12e